MTFWNSFYKWEIIQHLHFHYKRREIHFSAISFCFHYIHNYARSLDLISYFMFMHEKYWSVPPELWKSHHRDKTSCKKNISSGLLMKFKFKIRSLSFCDNDRMRLFIVKTVHPSHTSLFFISSFKIHQFSPMFICRSANV